MGLEIGLLAGIGSLIGGIGGAVSGAQGTPDEVANQTQSTNQISRTTFEPISEQQRQLQQQSLQNYLQQQALIARQEGNLPQAEQLQNAAIQQQLGIIGGSAFSATPEEQAQIEAIRNAQVGQSQADINQFLDQRLQQLNTQAGARGVRGQALSQLQGDALQAAAQQLGASSRQAASQAAQSQLQLPYQRLSAQSPFLQSGANFAEQLRQQAITNRNVAQSPFLLQQLQQERLAGGTQQTSGTSTGQNVKKGQEGSLLGAIAGGLGGLGGGAQAGANLGKILGGGSSPTLSGTPTAGSAYENPLRYA